MSDSPRKTGCGGCCMGRGCLALLLIVAAFVLLAGWGYHLAAGRFRQHYTSSSAAKIPVESGNAADYESVSKRMEAFRRAAPGSNATLTLTAHDLNLLIAYRPEWAGLRGKVTTRIEGNDVKLTGSIPLSSIPGLRDQFANGTLRFTPSIENKVLHVTVRGIKAGAGELPVEGYASGFIESQLTNRLLGDPVIGRMLIEAGTMKVRDGALVLTRSAD